MMGNMRTEAHSAFFSSLFLCQKAGRNRMNQKIKYAALGIALACTGWTGASAEQVYELNPVTVTAQRMETTDLKTPAAVEVLTADEIQKTGATSVHEALKFSTGIIMHAQGPRNISQGTMTNKAVIRGVEKGTLVLVDGVPINQSGRYNLEDIPTDAVEKIEIVRGGGAVLYGSEASGGVINIITKGKRNNRIQAGIGNYGIQNYVGSFQSGPLGLTYQYDHTGHISKISAPSLETSKRSGSPRGLYYDIIRGEHSNVNWRYNFSDHLFFTHTYGRNSDHYRYIYDGIDNPANKGKTYQNDIHSTEDNLAQLRYDDGNLKAGIYYNRREQETKKAIAKVRKDQPAFFNPDIIKYTSTGATDQTIGADISNRWKFKSGSFMVGYSLERDLMKGKKDGIPNKNYQRNIHSLLGQIVYELDHKNSMNFNWRETWTEKDSGGNKYNKFLPEVVFMHDFDRNTMAYAKVGKSFMLPTFSQLYGNGNIVGKRDLKPQHGIHYEAGFKKNIGSQSWRFDVFHYKIKDSLEAQYIKNSLDIEYANEDIRNTGVELDWQMKPSDRFFYHVGVTYSHPEKQETNVDTGTGAVSKGSWHDYYGKIQLNAGIMAKTGKLTSSFEMSYLGKRTRDYANEKTVGIYPSMKAQVLSDLNFSYQANDTSRFFLNIDNLFNRHDIISTSSSTFYNLGRNFMLGYEYKF